MSCGFILGDSMLRFFMSLYSMCPVPIIVHCMYVVSADSIISFFIGSRLRFPSQYPTSCLLGCVNIVDCLPQEEYHIKFPDGECDSPFVFICEDAQELPIRFPIQGKNKICKLPVV